MMNIFLDQYGLYLGKKRERLVVKDKEGIIKEEPFFKIDRVFITSRGISISTDVIEECMKSGIQINFINFRNEPYAKLSSPFLQGTVKTRREQLAAYNTKRGLRLAIAFIEGKINNQLVLLKYMKKYRKKRNPELYNFICKKIERIEAKVQEINNIEGKCVNEVRQDLMTLEAHCAKKYWETINEILPDETNFSGRETRGATDLVNCMLNYGYAILYSRVQGAVILAGLDPYAGFLHVDRPGRASFVLDFMEEFRQQLVDKTVFAMINRGMKLKIKEGKLGDKTKKKYREKILDRLNSYVRYEGKKHKFKSVIQKQARHVATFIRGQRNYSPFQGSW